jgi:Ca-activated chloride channel homolog
MPRLLLFLILFGVTTSMSFETIILNEEDGPFRCEFFDTTTQKTLSVAPEQTKISILITDGIAQVQLSQFFINPTPSPVSVNYVFPLPHDGSVHGMSYTIDGNTYIAAIREKKEAQAIYDSIQQSGGSAGLLVQNKPNIFTQSIANIPGHDTVKVSVELSMPLKYADGAFELAFPTYIGQRFGDTQSSGTVSGSNPWNPPANVEGPMLSIQVAMQTGYPVTAVTSPTHPIHTAPINEKMVELQAAGLLESADDLLLPHTNSINLQPVTTYPNSDFVLRFSRSNSNNQDYSLAYWANESDVYFMYSLFPSEEVFAGDRDPLEVMVLMDISGSQNGWPLAKQKEVGVEIISRLNPTDRLGLLDFNASVRSAFEDTIVQASAENKQFAIDYLNSLNASGGTYLLDAVKAILNTPNPDNRKRLFVFLTDGFITNDNAIFDELRAYEGDLQLLTFGSGNNLNRSFLETAAEIGNGFSVEVTSTENAADLTNTAWNRIESPQISGLQVKVEGMNTLDLEKPASTSLYNGLAYTTYGKLPKSTTDYQVSIAGEQNGTPIVFTQTIDANKLGTKNWSVPKLWAKRRINRLEITEGYTETNKDTIISVSLEHQVLSKYTAFLAFAQTDGELEPIVDTLVALPRDKYEAVDASYGVSPPNISYSSQVSYSSSSGQYGGGVPTNLLEQQNTAQPIASIVFDKITTHRIELSVPSKGFTTLEVYDLLGHLVLTLVGEASTNGSAHFNWDANQLGQGTYLLVAKQGSHFGKHIMHIQK